jgi:hypothetical protein
LDIQTLILLVQRAKKVIAMTELHKSKIQDHLQTVRDYISDAAATADALHGIAVMALGEDYRQSDVDDFGLLYRQVSTLKRKADRLLSEWAVR